MKKVDLDVEFDKWKEDNKENLLNKFCEIHEFNNFLEETWQEYQQENKLIDKTNEVSLWKLNI